MNKAVLLVFSWFLFSCVSDEEGYQSPTLDPGDNLAVQAILDANGYTEFTIDSLAYSINSAGRIDTISFFGLDLSSLPSEIGQLSNLKALNVRNNNLISLPPQIGLLSNLESLTISYNNLISLPLEIMQLTNLEWFSLAGNRLCSLPASIESWIDTYAGDMNWRDSQICK